MAEIEAHFETLAVLAAEHARLAGASASLCQFEIPVTSPVATAAALGRLGHRVRIHLGDIARLHMALGGCIRAGAARYATLEGR